MKKGAFTVLLIPDKTSKIKKYKISYSLIKSSLAIISISFIVFFIFLYDYINLKKEIVEIDTLRKLTEKQKKDIDLFASKLSSIKKELIRLKELDKMIRSLTKLGIGNENLGIGGPTVKDSKNISNFEKKNSILIKEFDKLEKEIAIQKKSFEELHGLIKKEITLRSITPSISPTNGWISSKFGKRKPLFPNSSKFHEGIDIATWFGAPVIAPSNGIVSYVGNGGSYGKLLIINHGYGITTRYGHLSRIFVRVGQKVKRGDKIAAVGNSGSSTGPHLHYEVRIKGIPVDPERYILD